MAITSVRCRVLGSYVNRMTDLEGSVTQVVCADYDAPSGVCRIKQGALDNGPLGQLLERVAEDILAGHRTRCDLR